MKTRIVVAFLVVITLAALSAMPAFGDELNVKNKNANKLYDNKKYDDALKAYDNLILEYPAEQKLQMNKGSALYRLGEYDKSEETYNQAKEIKDKKTLSALYYNLGNAQFMEGEKLSAQDNQKAMEKYKAALENYIKSLDARPSDRDAKWNVQLAQKKIKQMEQQQQQKNNQDKQDKKNQDGQDKKNQDNQDKKDQDKQDKKDQNKDQKNKDDKKQDQQKQDQNQDKKDNQDKQKPEPTPQQQKQEDMKKEEAKRIIEQFSDDEKDLNKKPEKMGVAGQKKMEKDW
jgi:Ca-activated chloride channel homolog